MEWRVIDYRDTQGVWRNTDPIGEKVAVAGPVGYDPDRVGQGDNTPTDEDIESTPYINLGFQDSDGNWHYRWVEGPFDDEFWIEDAIEQIADEYGYSIGA